MLRGRGGDRGRGAYAEAHAELEQDSVLDSVVQSVKAAVTTTPSKGDRGGLYESLVEDDETVSPFSTASYESNDPGTTRTRATTADSRELEYVPPTPEYVRRRGAGGQPVLHVGRAHVGLTDEDMLV